MYVGMQRLEKAQYSHKTKEEKIFSRMDKYRTGARSQPALITHNMASKIWTTIRLTNKTITCRNLKLRISFNFDDPNHEQRTYIYSLKRLLLELMLVINITCFSWFELWTIKTINRLFGKLTTPRIQTWRAIHRPLLARNFKVIHRLLLAGSFKVIHRLL